MRSKLLVISCVLTTTGLLVAAASAPSFSPPGTLLADGEMRLVLGGACNNTNMVSRPCQNPNNDCEVMSTTCVVKKGTKNCWKWKPTPWPDCAEMMGWHCECTAQSEGCAEQYYGPRMGEGCPKGCTEPWNRCGNVKTQCTFKKCEGGD